MSNDGKILFNEKCSICNFEIKHYKKRSKLIFNDCSRMEDKYLKKFNMWVPIKLDKDALICKNSNLIIKKNKN